MGAASFPIFDQRESLRGALTASIVFHVLLTLSVVVYTLWGARLGKGWGVNINTGAAVHVNAVASLPGVTMTMQKITTPNTVAVENPGLYKPETVPKPPSELLTGQEIPKFKEDIKPKPKVTAKKRVQKEEKVTANPRIQPKEKIEPPPNAVPYGQGGQPTMSYSATATPSGEAGFAIGQQDFGERYGWYVQAVKSRVSNNWLLSMISPSLQSAPRVYVDFDINRDGSITNAQVKQSSGIPEVDRSALRAVLASSPLAPLPADYSGSKVSVEVYFDLKR